MGEITALGVSGKIELLATDLDGTLLTSRNEVSERTKRALAAAHEQGILVVPATGRGSVSARRVLAELDWLQWFITSNGAVIEDASGGERPTVRAIPAAVSHAVIDQLRSCSADYTFAWLTDEGFGAEHSFKRLHGAFLGRRQVSLTPGFNPAGVDVVKILVGGSDRNEKRLLASIVADLDQMDDSTNVSVAGSDAAFVEITAQGVDKGSALELLCGRLGIESSRVAAVGDQHNDVQMLTWAGCSVAMANAVPAVHQLSDLTTKNNDEDGVARVIEALLGESFF